MNAEGNTASNVINNSAISNLLKKQIHYHATEEDVTGLNKLKGFVTMSDQYKHNLAHCTRCFYDENGRIIKPGLC